MLTSPSTSGPPSLFNKVLTGSNMSHVVLNGSNLKYICEVCGILFPNVDSLKLHLNIHNGVKPPSNESQANFNDKPIFNNQNSKISSLIAAAKNGLINTTKKSSSIINIPQSMTVFNLKEISSKLSSFKAVDVPKQAKTDTQESVNEIKTVYQLEPEPASLQCSLIDIVPNSYNIQTVSLTTPQNISLNSFALPYHFSEYENIYICNLCNCTYDSQRSIKAHLWKHSGHHELSYPIQDYSNRIAETTGKPIMTLTPNNPRKTIRSLQIPLNLNVQPLPQCQTESEVISSDQGDASKASTPTSSMRTGGICSALLEVIEKLRDAETSTVSTEGSKTTRRKRKSTTETTDSVTVTIGKKPKIIKNKPVEKQKKEAKLRKKRKTSKKVNQLIQIHQEQMQLQQQINNQCTNQVEIVTEELKNQNIEEEEEEEEEKPTSYECTIETSVVNSLYEDEDALLTKLDSSPTYFSCLNCLHLFTDLTLLNSHKSSCTTQSPDFGPIEKVDKSVYLCDMCQDSFYTENSHFYEKSYFKSFSDLESLNNHFKSNHSAKRRSSTSSNSSFLLNNSVSPSSSTSSFLSFCDSQSQKNSDLLKLLELLANNDGNEQYVCGLCSYICYHLPSLKSHMWTHVKNEKFDYSVNTSIINAALDYENKLNRNLSKINHTIRFCNGNSGNSGKKSKNYFSSLMSSDYENSNENKEDVGNEVSSGCSSSNEHEDIGLDKRLSSTFEFINLSEMEKKLGDLDCGMGSSKSMVSFRCSKCGFETVDLCLLRLHKREHLSNGKS